MKRPTPWEPHTPVHHVARNIMGSFPSDTLLSMIREHAGQGERVRVRRPGFRAYDVVSNGPCWLVLPTVDEDLPIGTYSNICAAVLAGDAHVDAVRRGEFDAEDCDPSGDAA